MKKHLLMALLALSASGAQAADLKPFALVDTATEKDSLANEYVNANITVGVKTPGKFEYSMKLGASEKSHDGSETYSRNVEGKIKKSFDLGLPFSPYVALRLGQKTDNGTSKSIAHWATDVGLKMPVTDRFALDLGVRYRDAIRSADPYQSTRYHLMGLYEIDPSNIIGLRYSTSTSSEKATEDRSGWRIHYQHNY